MNPWVIIENSYFWICFHRASKDLVIRFCNPSITKLFALRLSLRFEATRLIREEDHSEKVALLNKRINELDFALKAEKISSNKVQKLEQELAEAKAKLKTLKDEHKQA